MSEYHEQICRQEKESHEVASEVEIKIDHDRMRERNAKLSAAAREVFKDGDWVFGIGEHEGCSQIFTGTYGDFQPFSYLGDFDPKNFRIATEEEILAAKRLTGEISE